MKDEFEKTKYPQSNSAWYIIYIYAVPIDKDYDIQPINFRQPSG